MPDWPMRFQRDRLETLAGASFTNVVTRGAVSDGLTNHMRFAYDHAREMPLTAQNMAAAYPNQAKTPFGPAYRFSHLTDGLGLTDAAGHDLNAASAKMAAITVGFDHQSLGALNGCYSWSAAPTGFSFRLNENGSGFLGLQSGSSTHYTSGVPNPSAEGKLWAAGFTMTRGSAIRFSAAGISEDYGAWNYADVGGYPDRFCLGGFRQGTEFAAGSSVQLVTLLKGGAEIADDALEFLCDDPRVILSCFTPGSSKVFFLPATASAAELSGSATASATASAQLTTAIALSGAANSSATLAAALTTAIRMSGSAAASGVVAGQLSTAIRMSGAATAQATGAAALTTAISLSGAATATATASGALAGDIALAGQATASATASASLTTSIRMSASAAASANTLAQLSTAITLSGVATAAATVSGALTSGGAQLVGAANSIATVAAQLTTGISLSGLATASATAQAALTAGQGIGEVSAMRLLSVTPSRSALPVTPARDFIAIGP